MPSTIPPRWLAIRKKIVGAQPGLDVLEGDVVHFFANRIRMADCVQHQPSGVADIDFGEGNPSARASLIALFLVCSPVANPGNANARMSLRGRPSRSMAWVATISACVESNPRTHR